MTMLDPTGHLRDPYELRDNAHHVINFSGGRSSAYMLCHIVEQYRGTLPDGVHVAFCNTGKEHPGTLDFVHRVGRHLDVAIHWLEYRYDATRRGVRGDARHLAVRVDYDTASRDGRPFQELLDAKSGMLPSYHTRFCTEQLKVHTLHRHFHRGLGLSRWHSVLGVRADELNRVKKILDECRVRPEVLAPVLPLFYADVRKPDVLRYWRRMPFDLNIPDALGNCDMCFLKSRRQKARAIQQVPGVADWWLAAEARNVGEGRLRDPKIAQWDEFSSVASLIELARTPDLLDSMDEEDGGLDVACHCTD